jgi:hypothetical protein
LLQIVLNMKEANIIIFYEIIEGGDYKLLASGREFLMYNFANYLGYFLLTLVINLKKKLTIAL